MIVELRDADFERLVPMREAIDCVREALALYGRGEATNLPRRRVFDGATSLHVLAGGIPAWGTLGTKNYTWSGGGKDYRFSLYAGTDGRLLAHGEARSLGNIRTAAATAIAVDALARDDARVLAVYGSGKHAMWQTRAVACVRKFDEIRVYSPTPERRQAFARTMSLELSVPVTAMDDPARAAAGADVVVCMTTSWEPVLEGAWLTPGTHVTAAGANDLRRRELDAEAVARCGRIYVDSIDVAKLECGDLMDERQKFDRWPEVREIGALLNESPRRTGPGEITLFESQGLGVEDVAVATYALRKALAELTPNGDHR